MIFNGLNMIKHGIKNYVNQRLNQLQIESTHNRIYQWLNQPIIAKSKKVKVESQRRSKTHQSAGLWHFTRLKSGNPVGFQSLPALAHGMGPHGSRIRAGELEAGSCKLGTELQAGNYKLVKSW